MNENLHLTHPFLVTLQHPPSQVEKVKTLSIIHTNKHENLNKKRGK